MLITRTESYTDWVYQGALADETAAWNGVGLYEGSIYFRHSHDTLKPGERILREEFFVELSDGSTYPLGEGASRDKITIINHGTTSDGSVYLEVKGNPDFGVGVSRITQNITIEYDDGRVPVLDTDQLNEVLSQLNDSLTASMKDTADAVRSELREELRTGVEDSKQECNMRTDAVKTELERKISDAEYKTDTVKNELTQQFATLNGNVLRIENELQTEISTVSSKVDDARTTLDSKIDAQVNALRSADTRIMNLVDERIDIARWVLGQYTVAGNSGPNSGFNVLTSSAPTAQYGSTSVFTYSSAAPGIKVDASYFANRYKLFRVDASLILEADSTFDGPVSVILMDADGNILSRNIQPLNMAYLAEGRRMSSISFSNSLFFGKGTVDHPLVTKGVKVVVQNGATDRVTVAAGSYLILSLM